MSIVIKVALCARAALAKGVSRVLIVDWDVHHGQVVIVNRCNVFFFTKTHVNWQNIIILFTMTAVDREPSENSMMTTAFFMSPFTGVITVETNYD